MLKKSARLPCSCGLFGLSGVLSCIGLTRWIRKAGLVSDVWTSEISVCPLSSFVAC